MLQNYLKHIRKFATNNRLFQLKYGLNAENKEAGYFFKGDKKFDVINGNLSFINVLDAMLGWNLVNEASHTLGTTVCASYKHNAPAGVSCLGRNTHNIVKSARECDPLSSFGDFISVNTLVDKKTAMYLRTQVSDGIIAEDYTDEAYDILKKKKKGQYIILKGYNTEFSKNKRNTPNVYMNMMDDKFEYRDHFGVTLYQSKDTSSNSSLLPNVSSFSTEKQLDALLGWITLKYTPSNSVNFIFNKQVIGIGAGQQNRVACIRIAGEKCNTWEEANENVNKKLSGELIERSYTMCSDGFLPFKDNIDVAKEYNVDLILQPGGSINDALIKRESMKNGISMVYTNKRQFYH
jgi:AICAR transformylase/IMP cyclohydrolase PurH